MQVQPKQLNGRPPLVQFRAGKMILENGIVRADLRSGLFSLVQETTGLIEILWTSGSDCDSYIVPSGDATFNRVKKCTTGRVFVLDMKVRTAFFWLQEKSEENDERYLKQVKRAIGDKTTSHPGAAPAPAATASAASVPSNSLQMDALQRILSNLGPAAAPEPEPSLQDIIMSQEVLEALRSDPAFYMARVHSHLPEGTEPDSDVVDELRNPQVQAAAAMLQAALSEPDGFRELCNAFGLRPPAGACGLAAFLKALTEKK
jgi:26S proteasome regulatory subunit N13